MKNLVKTDEGFRDRLKRDYIHAIERKDACSVAGNSDGILFWCGYLVGIEKYLDAMGFVVKFTSDDPIIEIVERD